MQLRVGDEVYIRDYSRSLMIKDGELVNAYGLYNRIDYATVIACCGLVLPQGKSFLDPTDPDDVKILAYSRRCVNNVVIRRHFDNSIIFIAENYLEKKQPK